MTPIRALTVTMYATFGLFMLCFTAITVIAALWGLYGHFDAIELILGIPPLFRSPMIALGIFAIPATAVAALVCTGLAIYVRTLVVVTDAAKAVCRQALGWSGGAITVDAVWLCLLVYFVSPGWR